MTVLATGILLVLGILLLISFNIWALSGQKGGYGRVAEEMRENPEFPVAPGPPPLALPPDPRPALAGRTGSAEDADYRQILREQDPSPQPPPAVGSDREEEDRQYRHLLRPPEPHGQPENEEG